MLPEEPNDLDLLGGIAHRAPARSFADGLEQRVADRPLQVGLQDGRVDVAAAGDRRRVAEPIGGDPDGLDDVAAGRPVVVAGVDRAQRPVRQNRSGPGPEVLGRHVGPGGFAEILVHVVGGDVVRLALVVDVLEELLAGQVLASA